jgi:histidinol-phosphate aminotransferase
MAGMRLGYGITSEPNARKLLDHAAWSNVNVAVAMAGVASLQDQAYAQRIRILLNGTRQRLCAALKEDGRRFIPSHTNFVMIDVGGDVRPVVDGFRARGIRVGRRFPAMPNWLRVSIGTPEEMTAFLATLRELVPVPAAAAA